MNLYGKYIQKGVRIPKFHTIDVIVLLLKHTAILLFSKKSTFFKNISEKSFLPSDRTRFIVFFHAKKSHTAYHDSIDTIYSLYLYKNLSLLQYYRIKCFCLAPVNKHPSLVSTER